MAHWLIDTAGIGALIAITAAGTVFLVYVRLLRWIAAAPRDDEAPKARGE
jgi:hypothetical protein